MKKFIVVTFLSFFLVPMAQAHESLTTVGTPVTAASDVADDVTYDDFEVQTLDMPVTDMPFTHDEEKTVSSFTKGERKAARVLVRRGYTRTEIKYILDKHSRKEVKDYISEKSEKRRDTYERRFDKSLDNYHGVEKRAKELGLTKKEAAEHLRKKRQGRRAQWKEKHKEYHHRSKEKHRKYHGQRKKHHDRDLDYRKKNRDRDQDRYKKHHRKNHDHWKGHHKKKNDHRKWHNKKKLDHQKWHHKHSPKKKSNK